MENDHPEKDDPATHVAVAEHPQKISTEITVVAGLTLLIDRVGQLAQLCEYFAQENQALRAKNAQILAERDVLHEKNEQSRTRIEMMVVRLKALGQEP